MELYFKPTQNGSSRVLITDEMSDDVKLIQRSMANAGNLLPVSGYTTQPALSPFGVYHEKLLPVTDQQGTVVSYAHSWEFRPLRIRVSQEKLLADPALAPLLNQLSAEFTSDPDLIDWWTRDPVYVRGSALATKAMKLLNVTQEQLETIVLRCRY